uniref:Uncharacterized protein n=1 Tax=Loa loa TaxID=7209 RepID=A0A1I7W0P0_LOALO
MSRPPSIHLLFLDYERIMSNVPALLEKLITSLGGIRGQNENCRTHNREEWKIGPPAEFLSSEEENIKVSPDHNTPWYLCSL